MLKKKIIVAVFGALMFNPVILPQNNFLPVSVVCAEVQTIEADGYYTMGDGLEENQGVAKERARESAKRAASEKACLFIETLSEIKNNNLTRDEIVTISANVLQVVNDEVTAELDGNSVRFHCHITVTVDTNNVTQKLWRDKQRLAELTTQLKEKDTEIDRLNAEIEMLKQNFKTANEVKRKEIKVEVKHNENQFTAVQWNDQGLIYFRARDFEKALEYFNKAIEFNPKLYNAWSNIGATYSRLEDYEKANEALEKSLEINPKNYKAWNNLGSNYSRIENYPKAIECLLKALEIQPTDITAYYNLSRIHIILGENDNAIEYAAKAVEMNPDSVRALFYLGKTYYDIGNYEKSLEIFDKVVALRPNSENFKKVRDEVKEKLEQNKSQNI